MRKYVLLVVMMAALMAASSFAAKQETAKTEYYALQVTFHNGTITNSVMNAQEYSAIMKEVEAESAIFQKAMQLAEADWKSDSATKDKSFSRGAVSQKKVKILDKCKDEAKATEKVVAVTKRLTDREKEKAKAADDTNKKLKLSDSVIKEREKKRKVEESRDNLVRLFFEKRLAELLGDATSGAVSTNKPDGHAQTPAQQVKEKK